MDGRLWALWPQIFQDGMACGGKEEVRWHLQLRDMPLGPPRRGSSGSLQAPVVDLARVQC